MSMTLKEIAQLVEGRVEGKSDIRITRIAQLDEAKDGDMTFFGNPKYSEDLAKSSASAVIIGEGVPAGRAKASLLRVKNVYWALARAMKSLMGTGELPLSGIHKTSIIGEKVELGKNVAVGAYVVIGDGASIGDDTRIHPNSYIGSGAEIGRNVLIHPSVTIAKDVIIGNNVIIQSGTVVGSDGYGYAALDGRQFRIPQLGTVEIGDDVEIGANVTIDRATLGKTVIGAGTKIDNLVMIAHNVKVGRNCTIVAQSGIAGSTVIGDNVTLAGQSGVVGHVEIGDNVIVGAQAGVTKSVPPNQVVSGYPARKHSEAKSINAHLTRLPKLYRDVEELKKIVNDMEKEKKSG